MPPVWHESLKLAAYLVALPYCWWIRGDSPPGSAMRRAWTWMGYSTLLSVLRHLYEMMAEMGNWPLTERSWRQILIVSSLVMLTAGLLALGRAFREAGQEPRWRRVDGLWLLGLVVMAAVVVVNRERLTDAGSGIAAMRYLQFLSSLLLAAPAMVALELYRISRQMSGGRWAIALLWMAAFLVLRLVNLCLGTAAPELAAWLGWSTLAATWCFPVAAIARWRMTRAAERMREQIFSGANKPA